MGIDILDECTDKWDILTYGCFVQRFIGKSKGKDGKQKNRPSLTQI